LSDLDLRRLKVINCLADDVDFSQSNLSDAVFTGTNLTDARFHKNQLLKADFRGAKNYTFDPGTCKTTGAKFSFPEVLGLLACHGIIVE
jgi:uncharacterized protein YjbI with pentapeptide repeats